MWSCGMIIHESRRVGPHVLPYSCQLDLCCSKFVSLVTDLHPLCRDFCVTHPLMQEINDPPPLQLNQERIENSLIPWFPVTAIKERFLCLVEPEDTINHGSDNRNNQAQVINLWLTNYWSILSFKPKSKIALFCLWKKHSLFP